MLKINIISFGLNRPEKVKIEILNEISKNSYFEFDKNSLFCYLQSFSY